MISLRRLSLLLVCAAVVLVNGCMTVESTTVNGRSINEKKAAEEHVKAAMSYLSNKQVGEAQRHLTRALELDKTSISAHNALALSYNMTGEYELAEKSYKDLLAIDPSYSPARNNYAAFLFQQNRVDEACAQLATVVLDPSYQKRAAAYYNLGVCRQKQKDFEAAKTAFTRSVALDQNVAMPYLELADLTYNSGDYELANKYYARYREQSSGPTAKSLLLGIKLAVESEDENATASRVLALKSLFPESPEYREYQRRAKNYY
ncbi:type IV pilus biogenesis/stability protein PilW [Sinobacterium caligoides]|uniref:type IV pilus biogenesis/stability protein PilW n=1 Tax=Sinobacterium caligoides TaxID=933926 RepID=UPI0013C3225A|nr:type IV pilus biogenesis/stability protein PilW [Sinobacterium caligoides]